MLFGALVGGPANSDTYQDVRTLNGSAVVVEYNAGFQASSNMMQQQRIKTYLW